MSEPASRPNRSLLIKLGVAAFLGLVLLVLIVRGLDLKNLVNQALALIREAGPVVFFIAMAILPAIGFPLLAFSLSAGPVFGERLGLWPVIVYSLLAVTVNIALSYFLATRALRPLLEKLFTYLGYKMPKAESGDATDLIVLLRVTPGVPFPVQNYLLGLAQVPFWKYLGFSTPIIGSFTVAVIYFGEAMLHGSGWNVLIGLSLIFALTAGTHLLRKHYGKKKTP